MRRQPVAEEGAQADEAYSSCHKNQYGGFLMTPVARQDRNGAKQRDAYRKDAMGVFFRWQEMGINGE